MERSLWSGMVKVFLICGVPGSGKTWICKQLTEKFTHVANDDHIGGDYCKEIYRAARSSEKPVLADCPFAERLVRDDLIKRGLDVTPLFIVEAAQTVKKRYEARDGMPIPTNHLTRAMNIGKRADEWRAPKGTSQEILEYLRGI